MNKKLLVTLSLLAATGAMALAGCKGSSSGTAPTGDTGSTPTDTTPTVDPISDIEVTRPEGEIVVGDVLDLDTYFTVVGGTDPKGYTVTVRSASADVVSLEGHTLTVLKEGPISLKVEAGDESVLVDWEALSAIKASFKTFAEDAAYEYALTDIASIKNDGTVTMAGTGNKHNSNYFYSYSYDSSVRKNVGEGMIKLADGKQYDFTANDLDGAGFEVAPGGETASNWEYYFVNMGLPFDYTSFTSVTDEDGYTSLVCDASVPAPSGMEDYAVNMPAYILLCSYGYKMSTTNCKADTFAVTLEETSDADTFLMTFTFEYSDAIVSAYGSRYAGTQYGEIAFLEGPEASKLAPAEAYLEAGTIPEALSTEEISTAFAAMDTAKNYTVMVEADWINLSTGEHADNPLEQYGASVAAAIPQAEASYSVVETAYDGEAAAVVASLETSSFSSREVDEETGVTSFGYAGADALPFLEAVFGAAGAYGANMNTNGSQVFKTGLGVFNGSVDVYPTGEVLVAGGFNWDGTIGYSFNIVFMAVGTTTLD